MKSAIWFIPGGVVLLAYFVVPSHAVGQTPLASSSSAQLPAAANEVQAAQADLSSTSSALAKSFLATFPAPPTALQLQSWQNQHADALARYQQLAFDLGAASALTTDELVAAPRLSVNASSTLKSQAAAQVALVNARIQIHNQLLNGLPAGVISEAQISEMQQRETQLLEQQQGGNLQLLAQRAQDLSNEPAGQVQSLPPPLIIPAGTSVSMASALNARDQLLREYLTVLNQNATATPQARQAVLAQWTQQNSARLQQTQDASLATPTSSAAQN